MSGSIVTLRNLVATQLEAERVSGSSSFSYKLFSVGETHLPIDRVEKIPKGVCYVLGLANDYTNNETRKPKVVVNRITRVQVSFQIPCNYTQVSVLDTYVDLIQQMEELVMGITLPDDYQFLRIESLKDPNDVPYCYTALRESSVFEAYFTAFYKSTLHFG